MSAALSTPAEKAAGAGQRIKLAILVTGADLAPEALALLTDYHMVYAGEKPSDQDIVDLCRDHNPVAIIVRYGKIGALAMDAAPALRVISKHGSGIDTIDKAAAEERHIEVVAAAGANAAAVAEQALTLLLACAKSVVALNTRMHSGHWDKATHKSLELGGKTLGLIGLGAIGLRTAKLAAALDMRIIGFDPYAKGTPDYVQRVDLQTLWRESDVISLHCPLTDDNRGLINADTLSQCKRGVIIVNTARGGLIDEQALLDAIHSGQVQMAALDSFAIEPMVENHPFQGEKNIILSPHIGGVTADAYVNMGVGAAKNLLAVLAADK